MTSTEPPATNEQLAAAIALRLAAADAARQRGDKRSAARLSRQAIALKHLLFSRLLPMVFCLARRFAPYVRRTGLDEEDLLSEAYLRFDHAIPRYDLAKGTSVCAYIGVALRNRFIELGRKRRPEPRQDLDQFFARRQLQATARQELQAEVREVADGLLPEDPARDRKVLLFKKHRFDGWTMSELAHCHGLALATVHRYLTQTTEAFRTAFRAQSDDRSGAPKTGPAR